MKHKVLKHTMVLLCFLSLVAFQAMAQRSVSGKITDGETGESVPGASVIVKGTTSGTISDFDGNYTLNVPDGATLVFSFVGYETQEVAVGARAVVDVSMATDLVSLAEVVVVGYGEVEARDATGAVASVKAEDFNGGVVSSPEQLIQGRTAGVSIIQNSGEPGGGINIRIRGTSSVRSGNNPLFVVDGVPLSGSGTSGGGENFGLGSQTEKNPLNFLNPNDIASMDILKDASATAIYGSRGANGVVIITTKSGSGNRAGQLSYNYSLGISNITEKYDLLNAEEFIAGYSQFNDATATAAADLGGDTDWQDAILRTAYTNTHNLSYGGGDESGNYRISLSLADQEGIIKQNGLERQTIRFTGSKKFLDDKLTISVQATASDVTDDNVPITDNAGFEGDLLGNALKVNPTRPILFPDGNFHQPTSLQTEPNPVAMLELSKDNTYTLRTLGNFSAEYAITDDLSFKTVYGFDRTLSSRLSAYSPALRAQGITNMGRYFSSDVQQDNVLWENYFTYNKDFGSTSLNAVMGYSFQQFDRSTKVIEATGFSELDPEKIINNVADAGATTVARNSSREISELQSFFVRANVGIKDKYLFTGTLRLDGSTRFGPGNQTGVFPAFAFKWRISDEDFAPSVFSDLNLRAGWGITGNQEIPNNLFLTRQRRSDVDIDNGGNINGGGVNNVAFANPDIKWEQTSQVTFGLEYGFMDNRLRGTLEYYYKNTTDLLIQIVSAQPAASPFVWNNLDANVINKGYEAQIEFDAVDQGDFSWNIVANAAVNNNEVKNFDGVLDTGEINGQGLSGAFVQRIAEGRPLGSFFVREFIGFNAEGIAQYTVDAQQFVGQSALPNTTIGITNNFSYKDFDLSMFWMASLGHQIYSNTANAFFTAGSLSNGRNVASSVVGNGEGGLNAPDVSTLFLEDGDFWRLANLTLGYNIGTDNTFLSSLRVYVTGQNLITITDYSGQDPEVNVNKPITLAGGLAPTPSFGIDYTAYPRARTWTIGVNATF